MKKKEITDFILNVSLMIVGIFIISLGCYNLVNLKYALLIIFGFYTIIKLTQFIITYKYKDYQSISTFIISLISCIIIWFIDLKVKYLVLLLLIWMGIMCLIKLKKADFYHDRKNKIWILRIFILFVFVFSGLVTGICLIHSDIQVIVIGYFCLINSLLEAIDPLVLLIGDDNEDS